MKKICILLLICLAICRTSEAATAKSAKVTEGAATAAEGTTEGVVAATAKSAKVTEGAVAATAKSAKVTEGAATAAEGTTEGAVTAAEGTTEADVSKERTETRAATWEEAAAFLTGAAEVEELSEEVMEKFALLRDRPVDINAAPRGKLLSCGLFTAFQADELLDYRNDTGDILSLTELSLVPGFTRQYAEALRHFIVIRSEGAAGQREKKRLEQTLTLKASARRETNASQTEKSSTEINATQTGKTGTGTNASQTEETGTETKTSKTDRAAGLKYSAQRGERAELRWSTRTTYDDGSVKPGTISAAFYGKRALGKIVAGNFNARFGQGLVQWNGFSLSGYPTISAFRKNGTGLSPTGSFSSDTKGLGADWTWGHVTMTSAASLSKNNIASINNITWTGRRMTLGASCVWSPTNKAATVGTDWKIGLKDLAIFGELACKTSGKSGAALAGAIWTPKYGTRLALQARYFSPTFKSDWSGAALGYENKWICATADAARNIGKEVSQYKAIINLKPSFEIDSLTVAKPSIRINARHRTDLDNRNRLDLRGDLALSRGSWMLNARYNALWCDSFAWLWYVEAGRDKAKEKRTATAYLRFSLFNINNWDDRIYVYERDAPGSFNVPAYYGRGWSLSLVSAVKRRRHSFHFRGAWTSYPWNLSPKPGRLELKIQYCLSI